MTVDVLRLMLPMPHSCFFFYYDGNGVGWCFLLSWLYVNLSSFHYLSLADSQELKTSMGCLCRILQTSQCTSQMFRGIFFIALVWLTLQIFSHPSNPGSTHTSISGICFASAAILLIFRLSDISRNERSLYSSLISFFTVCGWAIFTLAITVVHWQAFC